MTELDKIKQLECYFPKIFADCQEKEYGVLFYNQSNIDSHDSNHAIIWSDDGACIREIRQFYLDRGLVPRIYSALRAEQLDNLRNELVAEGFSIEEYGNQAYLVWNGNSEIDEPYTLEFKRFTQTSDISVFEKLVDREDVLRTQKVIERRVMSSDYYLYIGYKDNVPVVMASFQFDENKTARLDEVETAQEFRGKGYARQMTRFLTKIFADEGGKLFYTWAANDTAMRVYLQGGFKVKYTLPHWSAFVE